MLKINRIKFVKILLGVLMMNTYQNTSSATNNNPTQDSTITTTTTTSTSTSSSTTTVTNDTLPSWDLTQLFENDEKALENLDKIPNILNEFRDTFPIEKIKTKPINVANITSALMQYNELYDYIKEVRAYAELRKSTNVNDESTNALKAKVYKKISEISASLVDFRLAMCDVASDLLKIINNDQNTNTPDIEALKKYVPLLRELSIEKEFKLKPDAEKIVAKLSPVLSNSWIELRESTIANIEFKLDDKNLTLGEILTITANDLDEAKRKRAFSEFTSKMKEKADLFATIYKNIIAIQNQLDEERGFKRPDHAFLLSNHLTFEMIDSFVNVVNKNKLSHKYYKIKAKIMDKNKLHITDRLAPITIAGMDNQEKTYSWDEGKSIVLEAFDSFSHEFKEVAKAFFTKKRIDATITKNKVGGAFCHYVSPSNDPFILLSYQNDVRSIGTLMHELGHGIHGVLSKPMGALMQESSLAFCEVASMFSEKILLRYTLDNLAQNNKEKIKILSQAIEESLAGIDRQIAFHIFETKSHNHYIETGNYTKDDQQKFWLETQKESLGEDVFDFDDDNYKVIAPYVGHFYFAPFYVHSYAVSEVIVLTLYNLYINAQSPKEKEEFVAGFKRILSTGSGFTPALLNDVFKIDMKEESFWQTGMNQLNNMIDELNDLLKQEGIIKEKND